MYPGTSKSLPRNVKIGSATRAASVPNVAEIIQGHTTPSDLDDKSHEV